MEVCESKIEIKRMKCNIIIMIYICFTDNGLEDLQFPCSNQLSWSPNLFELIWFADFRWVLSSCHTGKAAEHQGCVQPRQNCAKRLLNGNGGALNTLF